MGKTTEILAGDAQGGSESAFCRLYERLSPSLTAWARIRTNGPLRKLVDPEDVIQEVWWRALDGFPRYDAERASFRTWVFAIATNVYSEMLRKRPSARLSASRGMDARVDTLTGELQAQLTSITGKAVRDERIEDIVAKVEHLAPDERELCLTMGFQGLGPTEASAILGITPNAARKRWQRLRERLLPSGAWDDLVEPAGD